MGAKAPTSLQTVRSLLQFLDKKLEASPTAKPAMGGPQDLRVRLESHADNVGRLAALQSKSGWDARAKRILDIASFAAGDGEAAVAAVKKRLDAAKIVLEKRVKSKGQSKGETVDDLIKERSSWAQECVRREWLTWCARLLRAQEIILLAEVDKGSNTAEESVAASNGTTPHDANAILQDLLTGQSSRSAKATS